MPSSRSVSVYRNPGWFLALPALGILLLVAWAVRRADPRHQSPQRVLVVALPSRESGALEPALQQALATLLKDHLEFHGRASVTQSPGVPGSADQPAGREGWVLAFTAFRRGQDLEVRSWVGPLASVPVDPPLQGPGPRNPLAALVGATAGLPGILATEDPGALLAPRNPEAFWNLLQAQALLDQGRNGEGTLALAEACAKVSPDCASPMILKGQILASRAQETDLVGSEVLDGARESLEAALRLAPEHPRGSHLLARLLADTGRMREALDRARRLARAFPHSYANYQTLSYVGRTSGLMDLFEAGAAGYDNILLDRRHPPRMQIGLLYVGRWDAFEATLWPRSGGGGSGAIPFHLGYLELLRGRREQARIQFARVKEAGPDALRYRQLAEVFRLALEGRSPEALAALEVLDRELYRLRGTDGEFTFNLAEAYAFLGRREEALDQAERAVAQGFTCLRWYEQSPLVAPLRASPRWASLLQTLRERQGRLAELFPLSDFPT
jgi:tetratricopeptide (TPR) repeat protein